jgi:hypothetical protein
MMTLTMVFPRIPRMATAVVRMPSIQNEKKSNSLLSTSLYMGQSNKGGKSSPMRLNEAVVELFIFEPTVGSY